MNDFLRSNSEDKRVCFAAYIYCYLDYKYTEKISINLLKTSEMTEFFSCFLWKNIYLNYGFKINYTMLLE